MQIHRAITRRRLDERLAALAAQLGGVPPHGWIKTLRQAIGMSTGDVARRLAVSQQRACQLEQAEVDGSIRLGTLRSVAAALDCQLLYVFVPEDSLEGMVRRQARLKAAEEVRLGTVDVGFEDDELAAPLLTEMFEARTLELVDSPGLWRPLEASSRGAQGTPV